MLQMPVVWWLEGADMLPGSFTAEEILRLDQEARYDRNPQGTLGACCSWRAARRLAGITVGQSQAQPPTPEQQRPNSLYGPVQCTLA